MPARSFVSLKRRTKKRQLPFIVKRMVWLQMKLLRSRRDRNRLSVVLQGQSEKKPGCPWRVTISLGGYCAGPLDGVQHFTNYYLGVSRSLAICGRGSKLPPQVYRF